MDSLEQIRRSSRSSAWLTIFGVAIVILSLAYSYVSLTNLERAIATKKADLKNYEYQLEQSKKDLNNLRETQNSVLNFLVSVTDENNVHILDSTVDWEEVKKQISDLPAGDRKSAILNSILLAWKDIPFQLGREGVTSGFDSPRFLRYVLETVGVTIKDVRGQRLSDTLMSALVKVDKPRPGDLVFFEGQTGSFGFMLLSVGELDSEHVGVGTLQQAYPLEIVNMANINTEQFPLRGYFRVEYPDEKTPNPYEP